MTYTMKQYAQKANQANKEGKILKVIDGELVLEDPPVYEMTYIEKRKRAYPSYSEQLDMLYWDAVNGTTIWKDLIESIKAQYPKDV